MNSEILEKPFGSEQIEQREDNFGKMLHQTINEITNLLEARQIQPQSEKIFTIPVKFLQTEAYTDLGSAIILWLRLVVLRTMATT